MMYFDHFEYVFFFNAKIQRNASRF